MDFIDQVRALAEKALDLRDQLLTEEATKNALVMPFISALGYDVFNPREVVPEFTADVGTKKGEKVDYAIMRDGQPVMLIECKACGRDLDSEDVSQLLRYFLVTDVRFAVLTNGIVWRFYTDLEKHGKMDAKPFLEFDLMDIREPLVEEVKKFAKPAFDVDTILATASELKYTWEIKRILAEEYNQPSEGFVRFFAAQVYSGLKTQTVLKQFAAITQRALHQFINDQITKRLESALSKEVAVGPTPGSAAAPEGTASAAEDQRTESQIVTTESEIQAYYAVKAILHDLVDVKRVALRDRKWYCAVLLDDTQLKPIARLYFDSAHKQIGLFDRQKAEEKVSIGEVDDIYMYADRLRAIVSHYDSPASAKGSPASVA